MAVFHSIGSPAISPLLEGVKDKDNDFAFLVLGQFGRMAKATIPDLLKILKDRRRLMGLPYFAANSSRAYDSRKPQSTQRKLPMGIICLTGSLVFVQNDFFGAPGAHWLTYTP
jgi:hypothetical protein